MGERIRHTSIYLDGKKVATVQTNSYGGASGDESQIADEGYFGHTDGAMTTTLSADTIEPVRESDSKKIVKAMIDKKYLNFSVGIISGDIHELKMRCKSYTFDGDSSAGSLTGKFEFEGGEPKITGLSL